MNFSDLETFFAKAAALLQALIAGGIVKTSSGTEIATILADVTAIVQGSQQPTAELATQVEQLLKDLGTDGVIQGKLVNDLASAAAKFAAVVNDIQTGQAALLGTGDLCGKHGSYLFVADGGPAAGALGL